MSADNYIAIFKTEKGYEGINRFSENQEPLQKEERRLFVAGTIEEAVKAAQKTMGEEVIEYGYWFMDLPVEFQPEGKK